MYAIRSYYEIDPASLAIEERITEKPDGTVALVVGPVEIYLPLAGLVDLSEERARLESDLAEVRGQIDRLRQLLAGPFASYNFV